MGNLFKVLQLHSFVFFAFIIFAINSCVKGGNCEMADDVRFSAWAFSFKDSATGKYLYTNSNSLYNIDSLKVYDENNQQFLVNTTIDNIPGSSGGYYRISFGRPYNERTDAGAFNSEICRNYIIKYYYNQVDTVRACFKAKKTKCGSQFEYFNVFYKGELIGSVSNEVAIDLTINKK